MDTTDLKGGDNALLENGEGGRGGGGHEVFAFTDGNKYGVHWETATAPNSALERHKEPILTATERYHSLLPPVNASREAFGRR